MIKEYLRYWKETPPLIKLAHLIYIILTVVLMWVVFCFFAVFNPNYDGVK